MAAFSPKGAVRATHRAGFLGDTETEAALVMVDDRNLTSHPYEEDVAQGIMDRLPDHAAVLRGWVSHMRADPPGSR